MATFVTAINAIAVFPASISGISNAYTLANTPTQLSREKLPCTVVLPIIDTPEGYQTRAAMGGSPAFDFTVTQLVLWTDVAKDYGTAAAALAQFWDDYMTAIDATPFYTGASAPAVHFAPNIKPEFGEITYAGVTYLGITLRHTNLRINR